MKYQPDVVLRQWNIQSTQTYSNVYQPCSSGTERREVRTRAAHLLSVRWVGLLSVITFNDEVLGSNPSLHRKMLVAQW